MFAQTSSGKTHTMEGPSIHDEELAGVIPRTVREIFLAVAEAPDSVEFVIKVRRRLDGVIVLSGRERRRDVEGGEEEEIERKGETHRERGGERSR